MLQLMLTVLLNHFNDTAPRSLCNVN